MSDEMMQMAYQLALPVVVLALVTLGVSLVVTTWRTIGATSGKLDGSFYLLYRGQNPAPEGLMRFERHYNNLLEAPILFYATVPLILALGMAEPIFVTLAWWYVGLRVIHTLVHLLINQPLLRVLPWFGSYVVLCLMWINLLLLVS